MRLRLFSMLLGIMAIIGSGVIATWEYASGPVEPTAPYPIDITLYVFDYPPEEVLPDDEEASSIDENHLTLINNVLYEIDYGLNATKKPIIHNYLEKSGDVVYCEQKTTQGLLRKLLLNNTDAENLLFQVECVKKTGNYTGEYVIYTYSSNSKTLYKGNVITVYKTIVRSDDNGVWSAYASYCGEAEVVEVRLKNQTLLGIDSSKWKIVK